MSDLIESNKADIQLSSAVDIQVLYCDENLIIVDKPVNCIVHGHVNGAVSLLETLKNQLEAKTGKAVSFLAPSHRLDRNTSGPVVFSRNREAAVLMRRLFTRCAITKVYQARLHGILTEPVFIQADIIKGNHRRATVENLEVIPQSIMDKSITKKCSSDKNRQDQSFPDKNTWFSERSQNSTTISATVIRPLESDTESTLVEVHPWTGRFHQIRVISQSIGFPIIGDKKYNRYNHLGKVIANRREWSIPALICKQLMIDSLNISVESTFSLGP